MSRKKPIREYDSNSNLIYYKGSNGFECWRKYDSNSNCIHYKGSSGHEWWQGFDSKGKCIYFKNNNGVESWYWGDKETSDPIKILLLATQVHS
jgi:hypothetical protein